MAESKYDIHCRYIPDTASYLNQRSERCALRFGAAQDNYAHELSACKMCPEYLSWWAHQEGIVV